MRNASFGTTFAGVCALACAGLVGEALAGNPLVPRKGLCDPTIRIYNDRAYLYATHDYAPSNRGFKMTDWWVWSSQDLVNWVYESTLHPEETYYRKASDDCWATDAISRQGKYYCYFSMGPENIGVVTGDTPVGPWKDPLGKPLVPKGLTPTSERDPAILQEADGSTYLVFGTFDYYIARLNDDMISLAETPRKIAIANVAGPYGVGKADDKPFLHKANGHYYLSWGCFYAMSDNVYGPYTYKDCLITSARTEKKFQRDLVQDRHACFSSTITNGTLLATTGGFPARTQTSSATRSWLTFITTATARLIRSTSMRRAWGSTTPGSGWPT